MSVMAMRGAALGARGAQHVERRGGAFGLRMTCAPGRKLFSHHQAIQGVVIDDQIRTPWMSAGRTPSGG